MGTVLACNWLFVSSFSLDVFTSDPPLSFSAGNQCVKVCMIYGPEVYSRNDPKSPISQAI